MCGFIKQHGGPEIPEEMLASELIAYGKFKPDGLLEDKQKIPFGDRIYEAISTPGIVQTISVFIIMSSS